MEKTFPLCVRAAWDSATEAQQPWRPPNVSQEDSQPWSLPLFPKLGDISWNRKIWGQELSSAPCGYLREVCPLHKSTQTCYWGRGTGPPSRSTTHLHFLLKGPLENPGAVYSPGEPGANTNSLL